MLSFENGILYFGSVAATAPLTEIEPSTEKAKQLFTKIIEVDKDLEVALESARNNAEGFFIMKIAKVIQDVLDKHNLPVLDDSLLINYSGKHSVSLMMNQGLEDINFDIAVAALELYEMCNDYILFHRQAYEKNPEAYLNPTAEKSVFLSWINSIRQLEAFYEKSIPGFEFSNNI